MVNIEDILRSKAPDEGIDQPPSKELDPAMIAMDVVYILKSNPSVTVDLLSNETERAQVLGRLKDIYASQGLDVSDAVISDGITAFETDRYEYAPPKPGFGTGVAKLYIYRRRWLPLFYTIALIIGLVLTINFVGFVRPAQIEAQRQTEMLTQTLPETLAREYQRAADIAQTDALKSRINALRIEAEDAISNKDIQTAQTHIVRLQGLGDDLALNYQIRIVSRPGEYSGVFRLNDDGEREVRNYYLIVEGISASGETVSVMINSEEDQRSARVSRWGVRVPEAVFNRVAADKRDDQIIQNAIIGQKQRGYLEPDFTIETSGGTILDW